MSQWCVTVRYSTELSVSMVLVTVSSHHIHVVTRMFQFPIKMLIAPWQLYLPWNTYWTSSTIGRMTQTSAFALALISLSSTGPASLLLALMHHGWYWLQQLKVLPHGPPASMRWTEFPVRLVGCVCAGERKTIFFKLLRSHQLVQRCENSVWYP